MADNENARDAVCSYECYHYAIVRHYRDRWPNHRVIMRGLTLAQAQAHCSREDTHSGDGTNARANRVTRRVGVWFDGYTHE